MSRIINAVKSNRTILTLFDIYKGELDNGYET